MTDKKKLATLWFGEYDDIKKRCIIELRDTLEYLHDIQEELNTKEPDTQDAIALDRVMLYHSGRAEVYKDILLTLSYTDVINEVNGD